MANRALEDHDRENDRWVDERLAMLGRRYEWNPDAGGALTRLQAKRVANAHARMVAARRWVWTTLVAAGAVAALLLLPASRACAQQPGACVQRVLRVVAPVKPVAPGAKVTGAVAAAVDKPVRLTAPSRETALAEISPAQLPFQTNFKEVGSAAAPISVEIYIDYECLHCESFVREVTPLLVEQYVVTGKARLLYRDFPLPSHRYAKLAARYADAAGELGYYDAAMKQLFATRAMWSGSGDIDAAIAPAVPAEAMDQVRARIHGDSDPDTLSGDLAAGQADHLDRTPFVVIVSGGKRQAVTAAPLTFEVLKNYLDRLDGQ